MSRASRYIESNGFYHIISRSLNETRVMRDDSDFCHFIQLMHVAKQKYPISLFHYCLMNTHFHLAVQAPCHKILSQNISYLSFPNKKGALFWVGLVCPIGLKAGAPFLIVKSSFILLH
jgi:REP element-mobilizing transposase RayT